MSFTSRAAWHGTPLLLLGAARPLKHGALTPTLACSNPGQEGLPPAVVGTGALVRAVLVGAGVLVARGVVVMATRRKNAPVSRLAQQRGRTPSQQGPEHKKHDCRQCGSAPAEHEVHAHTPFTSKAERHDTPLLLRAPRGL